MSHRTGTRATDTITVERRTQTGTDDFGEPVYDRQPITDDAGNSVEVDVIRREGGAGYVRQDTGEVVRKQDTVRAPPRPIEFSEGDHLVFPDGTLEVSKVRPKEGRHGLSHYELDVEDT